MNVSLPDVWAELCRAINDVDVREDGSDIFLTLPFCDPYGDRVTVVLERGEEHAFVTDAGAVYHYLVTATGVSNPDAELWDRVGEIAARHGLEFGAGEIYVEVRNASGVAASLLALSAAASEAFGIARAFTRPSPIRFDEEVEHFLREADIPYRANASIIGSSKALHRVDFVIEGSREIVAQAVGSENSMRRTLNVFYDLTERSTEYIPVAFVDEARKGYSNVTFQQLSHKANVFFWAQRQEFLNYWRQASAAIADRETLEHGPPVPE